MLLAFSLFFLTTCQKTHPKEELIEFSDANFGVKFSYSKNLKTDYNPHGGANKVFISSKGHNLGGLSISILSVPMDINDFINQGVLYYQKAHKSESVKTCVIKNRKKLTLHKIVAKVTRNNEDFIILRYVYLEKTIGSMYITYSFEFLIKESDTEALAPEINKIIETFHIKKKP